MPGAVPLFHSQLLRLKNEPEGSKRRRPMTKMLTRLLFLGAVVLAALSGASLYLDHLSTEKFLMEKPFWIMNQRSRSYDFAVIGSSRAENCTDVQTIGAETGKRGVNMGVQGACFADNLIMLRRFLQNGNRVRLLLIEVDEYALDSRDSFLDPFKVHFYLPYLNDPWVSEVVRDNVPARRFYLWRYLPPTKYVEYNTMYLTYGLQYLLGKKSFDYEKTNGTQLEMNEVPFVFDGTKARTRRKVVDAKDLKYLNQLVDYATSKGMGVMLYTAPQFHRQLAFLPNRGEFLQRVGALCQSRKIRHVNYEGEAVCRDSAMFADASHLNSKGAVLFSRKLATVVREYFREEGPAAVESAAAEVPKTAGR